MDDTAAHPETPDPVDDDERTIDEDETDTMLPEHLDADFEEPIADSIDQHRVVVLDDDRDG